MDPDGEQDSTVVMTKEHAAAFKKGAEAGDQEQGGGGQAALECVNTPQSQDFAAKYIPKGLPSFCGEGDPPHGPPPAGSAWDDWCGEQRRKGNHPAEDQTKYFQIAIRCAAKLVIHSLNRGSAELIDALDVALDTNSPMFHFRREPNLEAHDLAMELNREISQMWREEGGPAKRMSLLDKAPWRSLLSMVKSMDSMGESSDILDRVAHRLEDADSKELGDTGKACLELMQHFSKENPPSELGDAGKACLELMQHFSKENQPASTSTSLIKGFFTLKVARLPQRLGQFS
ncbi:hypothetical protein T484DRAFT_1792510 [Baffinella frigidus]|nr:hypothetical protein T484DRAFT_1792510 [Cryptophyta sp. CCMP2293]